jgi:hypothetical protein
VQESWYAVRFAGTPVGISREIANRTPDGSFFESHLEVRVSRMGAPLVMLMRTTEQDDPDGRLVRFYSEIDMSGSRMALSGEVTGDTLLIHSEGGGSKNTRLLSWDEGAIGQATIDRMVRQRLKRGETEFTLRVFDPQWAEFRTVIFRNTGTVSDAAEAESQTYTRVEQYHDGADIPTITAWLNGDFRVQRMIFKQMGIEITIERITADEAGRLQMDPSFDVIRRSRITCTGDLDEPHRLRDVVFSLRFSRPVSRVDGFSGPNQEILRWDGRSLELRVSREILNRESAPVESLGVFLGSDRYIQSDHPLIRALADSIVAAGDAEGIELARRMAHWVDMRIKNKGFSRGFAPALEVIRTRAGDCTEHAVLLAALLRAAGIPARVIVGLAYDDGFLIGHMWTEAHVGYWQTVDALDASLNPVRLRITASSDERAMNGADMINAYSLIGDVEADVRPLDIE